MREHLTTDEKKRIEEAKRKKRAGYRAYSDAFNHVIVNMHGSKEYGLDLTCAIQLRNDLDRAINDAATSIDRYT